VAINGEYINVEDALKRMGGSMGLYKKLLQKFIDEDYMAQLEEALKNPASEEAQRQVHTVKGLCANLSLVKLAAVSVEMEHQLKDGADTSGSYEDMKQAYAVTLEQIAEVMG